MNILVTGANGFVGKALCNFLRCDSLNVVGAVRGQAKAGEITIGNIGPETDWSHALRGCDVVIHLAARVHQLLDVASNPLIEYRRVNVLATEKLARAAADAGVKRLIFLSSVKVNGEKSPGRAFLENDLPNPQDAYAISKWEAENSLRLISDETGIEVVILRPTLVYGPGVGANFLQLMQVVDNGSLLPLGAIRNRRSLLYLGNLVDAIALCIKHPDAAGKTFLVSDGEDVSTPELILRLAIALGRPARLLRVPVSWIQLAGLLLGKRTAVERLTNSLYVNSRSICFELAWVPPYTMQDGLETTAEWYFSTKSGNTPSHLR